MKDMLNVGILQYQINDNLESNLDKLKEKVSVLMQGANIPELVVGIEMGLGFDANMMDSKLMNELSEIARENEIYFIPCTLFETVHKDGVEITYNSLPIFNPKGKLENVYRKICPYYPPEKMTTPGDEYVTFYIGDVKIGVMICHDWCFPEISRNLTLMGAEVLVRPAVDPEGLYESFKNVPAVRALENQAYFISTNATGNSIGTEAYGKSCIANPEGRVVYEAGSGECAYCLPLDIGLVRRSRVYGTFLTEQLVRQLKLFNIPMPFANNIANAPVFKNLPDADKSLEERALKFENLK